MKKEDKGKIISQIADTIKAYNSFYLVETAGLDAEKTSELRRACYNADIKLVVVKNTLLHKALETLEGDYSELYGVLKESTSLMCTNVGNAPAKLLKDFVKKGDTLPLLKGAYVEDVVALLQSPAKNVVSALQSGAGKLHGILETLSKKEN